MTATRGAARRAGRPPHRDDRPAPRGLAGGHRRALAGRDRHRGRRVGVGQHRPRRAGAVGAAGLGRAHRLGSPPRPRPRRLGVVGQHVLDAQAPAAAPRRRRRRAAPPRPAPRPAASRRSTTSASRRRRPAASSAARPWPDAATASRSTTSTQRRTISTGARPRSSAATSRSSHSAPSATDRTGASSRRLGAGAGRRGRPAARPASDGAAAASAVGVAAAAGPTSTPARILRLVERERRDHPVRARRVDRDDDVLTVRAVARTTRWCPRATSCTVTSGSSTTPGAAGGGHPHLDALPGPQLRSRSGGEGHGERRRGPDRPHRRRRHELAARDRDGRAGGRPRRAGRRGRRRARRRAADLGQLAGRRRAARCRRRGRGARRRRRASRGRGRPRWRRAAPQPSTSTTPSTRRRSSQRGVARRRGCGRRIDHHWDFARVSAIRANRNGRPVDSRATPPAAPATLGGVADTEEDAAPPWLPNPAS